MQFLRLSVFALLLIIVYKLTVQTVAAAETAATSGAPAAEYLTSAESSATPALNDDESGDSAVAEMDGTEVLIRRNAPKGINESYFVCIGNAQGTIARAECMTEERDSQDARLNKTYKELMKLLNEKSRSLLISAQRNWLNFRSSDEEFYDSLLDDEQISNLQLTEDDIFRICKRANDLEYYLSFAKDL